MTRKLRSLLDKLEPAACQAVLDRAQGLFLPPEAEVYSQGDPVDGLYIVLDGAVKEVSRSEDESCLQFVRLVGPGEILGAGELFSNSAVHTLSAVTLRQTSLAWFAQPDIHTLVTQYPSVLLWIMERLARQLGGLRAALVGMVYVDSAARLTRKLVEVAERFGQRTSRGVVIDLKLSRDEWAALVGMAPETVSRVLHDLERRGWIALEGRKIWLLKEEKLQSQ